MVLNRGRHLYWAWQPSRWALAHILVFKRIKTCCFHKQKLRRLATVPEQSGPKSEDCCAPFRERAGSSSNRMPPGARPVYEVASWSIQPFGHNIPTVSNVTEKQTGQWSRSIRQTVACNGHPKSLVSICVRTRYMDKSNGDGLETENSSTIGLGVIGVSVSGLEKATTGLAKLVPVERRPPLVRRKPQILPSELTDQ